MSTFHHHAIVVTSSNVELLAAAHARATALGMDTLGPSEPGNNFFSTLVICPDGWLSNEGRLLDWVEVAFGDEELGAKVEHSSDDWEPA